MVGIFQQSWMRPGLFEDLSAIHGRGVFTDRSIGIGDQVIRWGGVIFSGADKQQGRIREHTWVQIDTDSFLGNPLDATPSLDDKMNHSCDGNLWLADAVTLVARRPIGPYEELTADYALWIADPSYRMKRQCNCKSSCCRATITGVDWQRTDVQERYADHFSPFINQLIRQEEHS